MSEPAMAQGAVRSFIRQFHTEILAEWRRLARNIPVASNLPSIELSDHIPDLLDQVAEIAERLGDDTVAHEPVETARRHAVDRLGSGFDVSAVVHELSMLRGCAMAVWDREFHGRGSDELRALNLAFDRAVAASVARYVEARDRTLSAIDTISTASLEATSLDDLLNRLLSVFLRTTAAADTAGIMLVEPDGRLYTRAVVGLEQELEIRYSLAKGEGFAGIVWEQGKPIEIADAYMNPLVKSPAIRQKAVRALYGIPLMQDGRLIGVAHMGSVSARQFAQEDRHLFGSMGARATVGIYHRMLSEQLAESEARVKAAAAERERALSKLEALLEASPIGIAFLDRDLKYLRINPALAAINGKPAAEHIGKGIDEMIPEAAEQLSTLLRRILETGEPIFNLEATHPQDPSRAFLLNYFPVRNAAGEITSVGGIIVEISEIHRVREALRVSEAMLRSIVEHAPVAIYLKDESGRIVLSNQPLAEALQRDAPADVVGQRGAEIIPAEYERAHRENDLTVMRENRVVTGEEVVPWNGGTRTFRSVKFPLRGENGGMLVCGISTEITDLKRTQQELHDSLRARDETLAIVSHDLRNPLATVELSATMLSSLFPDPRARKHVDTITRSVRRMETLIDDLLDASLIDLGRLRLSLKPESAGSVLGEAVELMRAIAHERTITLERQSVIDHVELQCDRDRLLQVFGNLIGNAVKFGKPGDTITVAAAREADGVRFSVSDTGPGIPAEMLPRLFAPYWSAPEHVKRGAGLGLYIARGIVTAHGGVIGVDSEVGVGTTFWFTIPSRASS